VRHTFKRVLTRDRGPDDDAPDEEEMPYRLIVETAFRNENAWLYHRYFDSAPGDFDGEEFVTKTASVENRVLHDRLRAGEAFLYHGTNPSSAMSILKTGFALRHAGSATGTMYGNGVYMAECASKSDEYGKDDGGGTFPGLMALLVCRCFVGTPLVVHDSGDHVEVAKEMGNHSVCGDQEVTAKKTYREFVFFTEENIYPEYAIIYRREYDKDSPRVPEEMKTQTTGTTGRSWQMRGDIFGFRGWRNVPVAVNKILIQAAKKEESVVVKYRGKDLTWDVSDRKSATVTDPDGASSPLRPPMQVS